MTDNWGEFTSTSFESWLQECGISHHRTSPYHAQSNGLCERFNGTIQKLLLKLTGGNPRKWTQYLSEALYAYRITEGTHGVLPYQAVFGKRSRLPRATQGKEEGERIRAIRLAEKFLHEQREKSKAKYQAAEPARAKGFHRGMFVSVEILNPRKGEPKYRPGFQVVSAHDGTLRLTELDTGRIIRINQRRVREIPQRIPYDEIDPPVWAGDSQTTNGHSRYCTPSDHGLLKPYPTFSSCSWNW